jgi:hypothetical protein
VGPASSRRERTFLDKYIRKKLKAENRKLKTDNSFSFLFFLLQDISFRGILDLSEENI